MFEKNVNLSRCSLEEDLDEVLHDKMVEYLPQAGGDVIGYLQASAGTGKTHTMGSGMDKTNEKLMPSCPGAKLLDGKVFASNINIAELNAWVESLKLYSE